MTDHQEKSGHGHITSQESGITTTGDVTQDAGRDIACRDIIYSIQNFLGGSLDARYWSGVDGDRRAAEQRRRLAAKIRMEYRERLEQVQGQAEGYPRPGLRTAPEAVADPLSFLQAPGRISSVPVPPHTSVLQIYQQRESLLILGEPGSGKTTMLLELAVKMLSNNESLLDQVPVLIPLSTWERRGRKMRRGALSDQFIYWLTVLLEELYKIPGLLAENWLKDVNLILLLDGLDEMTLQDERVSLLTAVNEYISKYSANVVLSCRLEEYQSIGLQAKLERAVVIQPLNKDDVLGFVRRQGTAYNGLTELLERDAEMLRLCTSPLFLSMLMFAYPLVSAVGLSPQIVELNTRMQLLRTYVDERFNQALVKQDYVSRPFVGHNTERSLRWLSWLANNLAHHSQTDFLLERMRPDWLPPVGQFLVRACLILATVPFILSFLTHGTAGIVGISLITVGVCTYLFSAFPQSFDLHWSFRKVFTNWDTALILSVIGGVIGLVIVALKVPRFISHFTIWPFGFELETYLAAAVVGIILGWVVGMLISGFTAIGAESRRGPYESVLSSLWTGAWVFAMTAIVVLFAVLLIYKVLGAESILVNNFFFLNLNVLGWDQAIHYSFAVAFVFAFIFGWGFVAAHFILRFWIWAFGVGPGRYIRWLNSMVRLRLLYRSGAGFVFMHRILQEFFQSGESLWGTLRSETKS